MVEGSLKNKGFNKLLYQKRLELGLSSKEASRKLKIPRVFLHLIENGYISLSEKLKYKFISIYDLDESFFLNDLAYPEMISEDKTPVSSLFIRKLSRNNIFKIVCVVSSVLFLGMALGGVGSNISTKNDIPSFYDQNVLSVRNIVIINYDNKIVSHSNAVTYQMNNEYDLSRGETEVYFDVEESDQKIPNTSFSGNINTELILPFIDETQTQNVKVSFSISGGTSYSTSFVVDEKTVSSISATKKGDNFEYGSIWYLNSSGTRTRIEKRDANKDVFTKLFEDNVFTFETELGKLFSAHPKLSTSKVSYTEFSTSLVKGNKDLKSRTILNGCLLIFGIVLACLFFALAVLSFFKRDPILENNEGNSQTTNEAASIDKEFSREKATLKHNWKIFPIFPGDLLRLISIVMIFIYSIGTYLLFSNIVSINLSEAYSTFISHKELSSFLVIAFSLLLFVKNDMVQQRKDYFLTNYFYFFSGLALYLLVLALSKISVVDGTIRGTIETAILNIVPGNFLWGFLAFNMIVFLLFYTPMSYKNDPKKLTRYRMLALIPLVYLIVSLVLGLLDSYLKLNLPFWLSFLFFTKSTDLIVFLILFTLFCFFYKHFIYKKYKKDDVVLFEKGNQYYFTKNIAACVIVCLIGIAELLFLLLDPNNPAGFGKDVYIFLTIPLMLLYHPHHGKRNGKIDWAITIFYGVANVIGIALIILGIFGFIIRYI